MKLVKTTDLEVGQYVALVMDAPNIGMELTHEGTIESVSATDMWGVASTTHTTLYIKRRKPVHYGYTHSTCTVHNSHNWLVRE